jgi:hypothetical protein
MSVRISIQRDHSTEAPNVTVKQNNILKSFSICNVKELPVNQVTNFKWPNKFKT